MPKDIAFKIALIVIVCLIAYILLNLPKRAESQATSITLQWIAPGDDGVVGTAALYRMRYSTTRPDTTNTAAMDSWWSSALIVGAPPLPAPLVAGTLQTTTITGVFSSGSTYYFVIMACDESANCSPYSSVASKTILDTIPPSRIVGFTVL